MDVVHAIAVGRLHRMAVFDAGDAKYLVLAQRHGLHAQLWRLDAADVRLARLADVVDAGVSDVVDIRVVAARGRPCLLFAGPQRSSLYCVIGLSCANNN